MIFGYACTRKAIKEAKISIIWLIILDMQMILFEEWTKYWSVSSALFRSLISVVHLKKNFVLSTFLFFALGLEHGTCFFRFSSRLLFPLYVGRWFVELAFVVIHEAFSKGHLSVCLFLILVLLFFGLIGRLLVIFFGKFDDGIC